MQCAEHEVSGLGAGQRETDRLEIAHFANRITSAGPRFRPALALANDSVCGRPRAG